MRNCQIKLFMHVKISQKKIVARKCGFTFRPISLKQLTSLTTIEVPGSIPGSGKGFYVWFLLLLLCFYFFVQNTLFIAKYCNSFYNVDLFSILNILQDLWPIIRVERYRPSIFKIILNFGYSVLIKTWQGLTNVVSWNQWHKEL